MHDSLPCLDCSLDSAESNSISLNNEPTLQQPVGSTSSAPAMGWLVPQEPSKKDLLAKYSDIPSLQRSSSTQPYTDRAKARRELHGSNTPSAHQAPRRPAPTLLRKQEKAPPATLPRPEISQEPVRYAVARTTITPRAGLGSQTLVSSEEYAAAKQSQHSDDTQLDWRAAGLERARKRFKKE